MTAFWGLSYGGESEGSPRISESVKDGLLENRLASWSSFQYATYVLSAGPSWMKRLPLAAITIIVFITLAGCAVCLAMLAARVIFDV